MIIIHIANILARLSCPMWCEIGVVRRVCRELYRWMAESPTMYRRALRRKGIRKQSLADLANLRFNVDTYPPLYADTRFAPWEEIADPDNPRRYNLISSRGSQVIRDSAGYCAQKIFELTGKYPERVTQKRFDAADWVEFLAEAGYRTIVKRPRPGHHYVGVIPGEGEFGLVVWFGILGQEVSPINGDIEEAGLYTDSHSGVYIVAYDGDDEMDMDFFCTTYLNSCFRIVRIDHTRHDVIWIQIN